MKIIRPTLRTGPRATSRGTWYESPWKIAARAIGAALAVLVLAALLALVVVPRVLGGDSLTVLSGSMEPTLAPGDVVAVKGISEGDVCTDISVGDIVTFFPEPNDPTLITHRVLGKTIGTFDDGTRCRLITQGDANNAVDEPVSPAQIRGVFLYGIPQLGWARQWVGENTQVVLFTAAGALVAWGLWSTFRRPRTTVSVIPRSSSGPQLPTTSSNGAMSSPAEPGNQRDAIEQQLRERELALRERELELREREFAYATQQSPTPRLGSDSATDTTSDALMLGASDVQSGHIPAIQRIEA